MSSPGLIHPLILRSNITRKDVLPFIILYISIYTITNPLSTDEDDLFGLSFGLSFGQRSLIYRLLMGLSLLIHIGLILSSKWSLSLNTYLTYSTPNITTTPTHLLIVPPPNSGTGGVADVIIVPHEERVEERAEFQGVVWKREKGKGQEFKRTKVRAGGQEGKREGGAKRQQTVHFHLP